MPPFAPHLLPSSSARLKMSWHDPWHGSLAHHPVVVVVEGHNAGQLELKEVTLRRVQVAAVDASRGGVDGVCDVGEMQSVPANRGEASTRGRAVHAAGGSRSASRGTNRGRNAATHAFSPPDVMQRTSSSCVSLMCSTSTRGSSHANE